MEETEQKGKSCREEATLESNGHDVHEVEQEEENCRSAACHGEDEKVAHNAESDSGKDARDVEEGDVDEDCRYRLDPPNTRLARRAEEMMGVPRTCSRVGTQLGAGSVEHDPVRAVTHARGRQERDGTAEARPFA